ncbi:sulfotransferase [Halioxenophilus sp. WMMB6]|uniref:sulfotransferase n=1 Tax=Halioxenophilus sp. WMMB6 TaxID=3073815 RepID=UPI00295E5C25|nr:sulfotransferase [Halioxenophilus sp. WMMB6]
MADPNFFSAPIFVTGLPRSGTSMVAGCLHLCGAWVGTTVAGGVGNPRGFFENQYLREQLTKPILTSLGCDPLGVKSLPEFQQVPRAQGLLNAFEQLLTKDGYRGQQPWLYKDAKMTLLWPIYQQVFPEARWVIVRRNPDDIIDSCLRTHFMAHHSPKRQFWQDFVDQYQLRLMGLKNSAAQVFEISADNLITGNSGELLSLANALELTPDAARVGEFIAPELWRTNA